MNLAEATPTSHAPSMNRLKIVTVILINAFIGTVFLKHDRPLELFILYEVENINNIYNCVPRQILNHKSNATSKTGLGMEISEELEQSNLRMTYCVASGHSFFYRTDGAGAAGWCAENWNHTCDHKWWYYLRICWNDLQTPNVSVWAQHIRWHAYSFLSFRGLGFRDLCVSL